LPIKKQMIRASDTDVIRAAKARGRRRKVELLLKAGGLLTVRQAADLLGVSDNTLVSQRLIYVRTRNRDGYPAFQFESPMMTRSVEATLTALDTDHPWVQLNFFFLRLQELGGKTPAAALREGSLDAVVLAAKHYLRHGAS
jgi:hypothetical protein